MKQYPRILITVPQACLTYYRVNLSNKVLQNSGSKIKQGYKPQINRPKAWTIYSLHSTAILLNLEP